MKKCIFPWGSARRYMTIDVYTHLGLDDAREELVRLKEARNVMKMKGVM